MPGQGTTSVWPDSQSPVTQTAIAPHVRSGLQSAVVSHGMPPMRSGGGVPRGQPASAAVPTRTSESAITRRTQGSYHARPAAHRGRRFRLPQGRSGTVASSGEGPARRTG